MSVVAALSHNCSNLSYLLLDLRLSQRIYGLYCTHVPRNTADFSTWCTWYSLPAILFTLVTLLSSVHVICLVHEWRRKWKLFVPPSSSEQMQLTVWWRFIWHRYRQCILTPNSSALQHRSSSPSWESLRSVLRRWLRYDGNRDGVLRWEAWGLSWGLIEGWGAMGMITGRGMVWRQRELGWRCWISVKHKFIYRALS